MEKSCQTCNNECARTCDECDKYDGKWCHQDVDRCWECLNHARWEHE